MNSWGQSMPRSEEWCCALPLRRTAMLRPHDRQDDLADGYAENVLRFVRDGRQGQVVFARGRRCR